MIQGHRLPFRADIQALRGVAVLAVLIFHLFPDLLPGGYGGVDLFFVISGYVVTYALLARQAKDPDREMGFSDYFKRRLRRIMPPLLVALLIIAAISYLIYDKRLFHSFSGYSITGLLGVSNLKLISQQTNYFSPDEYLNPYLHTWSLGIEEQFYLIFPLIFLPFVRTERRWYFWLAAGALWFASFLLAWHWSQVAAERAYLSPLSRFWELATGVLLALAGVTSRFKRLLAKFKKFAGLIQVFALLLLLLSFALLSNKGSYPMPGVVLPVLASAVLLGFGAGTPLAVLAQSNGLQALGAVSYSLYLYHWPCIVFARYLFGSQSGFWLPVALLATALLTWFSYRFVELGWSRSASLARLGLLGGFGLVGLALFDSQAQRLRAPLGLATFSEYAWTANDPRPIQQLLPADVSSNDAIASALTASQIEQLAPGMALQLTMVQATGKAVAEERRHLFVVGDSHAGSLLAAVRSLVAAKPGLVGFVVTPPGLGGCSLLSYSFDPGRCSVYEAQSLALVKRLAKPGDRLLLPSLRLPRLSPRLQVASYVNPNTPVMGSHLEPALRGLQASGVQVGLLAPWPVYNVLGKQCLGWQQQLKLDCNQRRADFESDRAPALERLKRLQKRLPGLQIIDPINLFCDAKTCSNWRGTLPLYADHDHLSGYGSAALGSWLLKQPQFRSP